MEKKKILTTSRAEKNSHHLTISKSQTPQQIKLTASLRKVSQTDLQMYAHWMGLREIYKMQVEKFFWREDDAPNGEQGRLLQEAGPQHPRA